MMTEYKYRLYKHRSMVSVKTFMTDELVSNTIVRLLEIIRSGKVILYLLTEWQSSR